MECSLGGMSVSNCVLEKKKKSLTILALEKYFEFPEVLTDKYRATCKQCGSSISSALRGASNITSHLKNVHLELFLSYKQELADLKGRRFSGDETMADAHWPVAQPVLFDQSHMMPRQFVANEPYQKALAEADNRMSPPQDTPLYDEEDFRVSHTQEEMAEKVLIELVKEQKVLYEPSDGDSGEISSIQMNMWEDIAEKMRKAGFESFTDGNVARSQWHSIKGDFTIVLRQHEVAARTGTAKGVALSWPHWNQMQWLRPFLSEQDLRATKDYAALNSPPDSEKLSHDESRRTAVKHCHGLVPSPPASRVGEINPQVRPSAGIAKIPAIPMKRRKLDTHGELLHNLGKSVLNLGNALTQHSHRPGDSSENVGMMVASQHRSLQPHQQMVFVKEIAKAYVNALNYESDTSNTS